MECERAVDNSHSLELMGNFRELKNFLPKRKKEVVSSKVTLSHICRGFSEGMRGGFVKEQNSGLAPLEQIHDQGL